MNGSDSSNGTEEQRKRQPVRRPSSTAWKTAVIVGLLTWTVELAILLVQRFALGKVRVLILPSLWLGPVVYIVLFGSLIAAAWSLRRLIPWERNVALYVAIVGIAVCCVVLNLRLHPGAAVLLGVGFGIRFGRPTMKWMIEREERLNAAIAGLATPVAIAALIGLAYVPMKDWTIRRGLPEPPPQSPNVVIVILDTVRALNMSLYGYSRSTTPMLERWADRAVTFDLAISTAAWTLPSHVGILSGRYPFEMSATYDTDWGHPLDVGTPVLPEVLTRAGYVTGAFVGNLYFLSREFGLDRGFARYEDHVASPGQLVLSTALGRRLSNNGRVRRLFDFYDIVNRRVAERINERFYHWLDGIGDRPFFAMLNYYDAHEPYFPRPPFRDMFGLREPREPLFFDSDRVERLRFERVPENEVKPQLDAYDAAIAYMDSQLDDLLRTLEERGLLKNSFVIITSDHGEMFGEHEQLGHLRRVYSTLVHVPLMMFLPDAVAAGTRVSEGVTLRDIPATILGVLDLPSSGIPGRPLLGDRSGPASPLLSESDPGGGRKSIVGGGFHLLRGYAREGVEDELYDLRSDPLEQHNLIGYRSWEHVRLDLAARMDSILATGTNHPVKANDASGAQE